MTPVWSPEAIDDLAALRAYIERDGPAAAQRVALRIIPNVETLLPNNPEMGRPGRVSGTRELVIPRTPFILCRSSYKEQVTTEAQRSRRFFNKMVAPYRRESGEQ